MVFLELRRDSRVTTGNSGCLLCWPREVQSSIRAAKESWGLLSSQMKEQTRNTEVQINKEEIGKLHEKKFRIMIVKIIKNLENKMEKMQESINKD